VLHFILTPCQEMNERFCLATIHHILQDEIEMFVMHPLPLTTQGTCHHLYEVNTNAIREISNHHHILFCAKRWTETNDVNLSIPRWRNFNRSQNNNLQSLSSLPPICLLCWKLEHCCSLNRLVIVSFLPSFRIYKSITRCCTFIRKKGPRSTFERFTQNKFCLLQSCHLKLNQVGPYLHWPHWWDKWPIDTIPLVPPT
jgi:hypothetical protein